MLEQYQDETHSLAQTQASHPAHAHGRGTNELIFVLKKMLCVEIGQEKAMMQAARIKDTRRRRMLTDKPTKRRRTVSTKFWCFCNASRTPLMLTLSSRAAREGPPALAVACSGATAAVASATIRQGLLSLRSRLYTPASADDAEKESFGKRQCRRCRQCGDFQRKVTLGTLFKHSTPSSTLLPLVLIGIAVLMALATVS